MTKCIYKSEVCFFMLLYGPAWTLTSPLREGKVPDIIKVTGYDPLLCDGIFVSFMNSFWTGLHRAGSIFKEVLQWLRRSKQ
jgi:hypothetical protein